MLGGTQEREKADEEILSQMSEEEQEFDEPEWQDSIRRLYLAGRIKKRKEGNRVFYRAVKEEDLPQEEAADAMTPNDRLNISRMARKFRSCRYAVVRNEVAANGITYTLTVTKKEQTYHILYVPDNKEWPENAFSRMLENDRGIRIVVPDISTKLYVAKNFDDFVRKSYPDENPLLCFNQTHLFCLLTVGQFFQKTTWKNLVR